MGCRVGVPLGVLAWPPPAGRLVSKLPVPQIHGAAQCYLLLCKGRSECQRMAHPTMLTSSCLTTARCAALGSSQMQCAGAVSRRTQHLHAAARRSAAPSANPHAALDSPPPLLSVSFHKASMQQQPDWLRQAGAGACWRASGGRSVLRSAARCWPWRPPSSS